MRRRTSLRRGGRKEPADIKQNRRIKIELGHCRHFQHRLWHSSFARSTEVLLFVFRLPTCIRFLLHKSPIRTKTMLSTNGLTLVFLCEFCLYLLPFRSRLFILPQCEVIALLLNLPSLLPKRKRLFHYSFLTVQHIQRSRFMTSYHNFAYLALAHLYFCFWCVVSHVFPPMKVDHED